MDIPADGRAPQQRQPVEIVVVQVRSKVRCSKEAMAVDIVRSSPTAGIYLQNLKDYPDEACKPKLSDGVATFWLSLEEEEFSRCGLTKVFNTVTGQKVYYHRVIVDDSPANGKHGFTVKCVITEFTVPAPGNSTQNRTVINRRSLPDNFEEPDVIDVSKEFLGEAPVPILGVGVRQGGNLVTGELNVSPGTPLQMEIYLDAVSAPIYGILVTYMQVSDTKSQEETIIFNGCSVDPYLFENFNTIDGDFLNARFRAFKFPESTYVQFRGTVNVCLNKCDGNECSNGQVGYGRKKRSLSGATNDKNNIFKVTMSRIIKVDFEGGDVADKALLEFVRGWKNDSKAGRPPITKEVIGEQFKYSVIESQTMSGESFLKATSISVILLCLLQVL
ncbi:uncharacterized protein LOC105684285 isoform X2 [Athalia rosae]|uniref:uncharacterized protein LOC105684285 isoform X2 n=1 Tax=Athalia rosae TaxID=37344 RepID=UPI0020339467|nr:uncharacterized protein LOC105684285 isoform X2 [Athalia rosae]